MEDKGLKSIALISGRAKLDDIAWKLGGYVAKQYIVAPGDYSIEVLKSGSCDHDHSQT